jgi:uncharacterized protein (DUF302 family)
MKSGNRIVTPSSRIGIVTMASRNRIVTPSSRNRIMTMVLSAVFTIALLASSPAFAADHGFSGSRVSVESNKSFDAVSKAVKSLVAKNQMMVLAEVDHGKILSMTGLKLNATLFMIGNPTVGKQLFDENHSVGLYVPLRLYVYSDKNGKTIVEYDKPSSLLGQYSNQKIAMVGKMLDEKIGGLALMAAK